MKKRMGSFITGILSVISLLVLFAGCSNFALNDSSESSVQNNNVKYGSISVSQLDAERALNISSIKYASVVVSGSDIETPITKEVSVSDGAGNITVSNIPVGKNRIITVYALDTSKVAIQGVTIRNIADIESGKTTSVSVNWDTTAIGNVFNELNNLGVDLNTVEKTTISNVIDSTKHALLINTSAIASDYKNNTLKATSNYVLTPATAKVNFTQNSGDFSIQVCDPFSAVKTGTSGETTISNIAPGTWNIILLDSNNAVIKTKTLNTFTSGNTLEVDMNDAVMTDIVVHAKYKYIYSWKTNETGTSAVMTEENSGWYGYTFNDTSTINLLFSSSNTANNDWSGKTADLSRTECGEYWYLDGVWYDSDPEKPTKPVVTATIEAGTYLESQTVTLSSTNGYKDTIYYTTDGSTPNSTSKVYSSSISISSSCILKAIGYCSEASIPWGDVLSINYVIDPNADLEAPKIIPNKETGKYTDPISINFSFTDNKGANGVTAYYTIDNSTPTTSSSKYTGQSFNIAKDEKINIRILAIDVSGNRATGAFYYYVGDAIQASRWDPRQESIYFLLTARWFDGNSNNTIGDVNCSYTEARANDNITDDGFSGPEDVTWRGDFEGLVQKMDYIKALGFTCIWITPIVQNRSPLCYHGYHAWDMYNEDARLVSPGYDFQRVIDEAHSRGMKICLDIVINHSGRFGLKDFAEVKYNRDSSLFPIPNGWNNFSYDEDSYQTEYKIKNKLNITSTSQNYPNNWKYDGLTSPGKYPSGWTIEIGGNSVDMGGKQMPGYEPFVGDVRPFTNSDISNYPVLANKSLYNWPSTESYCKTIDDVGTPGSLTYEGYTSSKRRIRGHNTGFPTGSGSFDNYPDATLDSLHEDCPDLNIENPDVQEYILGAYKRYIDMGVDMFRVDTVMHMKKETLNNYYWPKFMEYASSSNSKAARGGSDFFIFGEVGNFVNNLSDKPAELRQSNYVWDNTVSGPTDNASNNAILNGNTYRTIDKSHKAVPESDYVVSVIDIISHNGFCDGISGAYGRALGNGSAYWDASYLTWYTDSHDYGPNKGETRWKGDFAGAWSMLFTFRGIPIVYYGSEIRFAADKPNDWPGGGANGVNMSLEKTGRSYYGNNLEGSVTASDFAKYSANGTVATTLSSNLSKHLRDLNRMRLAIPALQMGQYSTDGHTGGWAGFKRRYTGKNKITEEEIDSYVLVGIGTGTHSWTGALDGTYIDAVTGKTATCTAGNISFNVNGGGDSENAALGVYVHQGLTTSAPGKVCSESPYFGF